MILFSGCTRETPIIDNTTSTPVPAETTPRPNLASPDTRSVCGHVYRDGKPDAGAAIFAVAYNGSDSLQTLTDNNGAYVLNIRPDTIYNVTAYDKDLKHTILPVYLHSTGIASDQRKDVADKFDINLTGGHKSMITGITVPGYLLIKASTIDDSLSATTVSNYTGQFLLGVEPGVEYRLSGTDYYEQIRFAEVISYYRNGDPVDTLRVGQDETVLVDMLARYPPP
jgi:hypothetical protein